MNLSEVMKLRTAITQASESLSDEVASTVPDLFDQWKPWVEYSVDDRRKFNGVLYKCLTAHTSQESWTPDVSPSLWVRTDDPGEEWPEWVQPVGSTDSYSAGDKVSHNNKHWISTVEFNTWEPGVYGWDEVV